MCKLAIECGISTDNPKFYNGVSVAHVLVHTNLQESSTKLRRYCVYPQRLVNGSTTSSASVHYLIHHVLIHT